MSRQMRSRIAKVATGFPSDKILFAPQHRDRQDYCGDMPQISAIVVRRTLKRLLPSSCPRPLARRSTPALIGAVNHAAPVLERLIHNATAWISMARAGDEPANLAGRPEPVAVWTGRRAWTTRGALPTWAKQAAATKSRPFESRFKINRAFADARNQQPERLAPRAPSNRNGGRDHLGCVTVSRGSTERSFRGLAKKDSKVEEGPSEAGSRSHDDRDPAQIW
jgi:hypothetical protein